MVLCSDPVHPPRLEDPQVLLPAGTPDRLTSPPPRPYSPLLSSPRQKKPDKVKLVFHGEKSPLRNGAFLALCDQTLLWVL